MRCEIQRKASLSFLLHPIWYLLLSTACGTLPPLRGKIDVGRESYAVFVGGTGTRADLYAVRAEGGPAYPITFSTVAELRPALSPDGAQVAFFRGVSLRDSTPSTLWVLNLLNGADRELRLPKGAGTPERVGWSGDGKSLVVKSAADLYRIEAPPAKPNPRAVPPEERAAAESTLAVLVGDPVFASVVPCKRADLCVIPRGGRIGLLAQAARDAARWGADSVAFFTTGDLLQIRPLARGRPRLLHWTEVPAHPRQLTYFHAPEIPQETPDQM